MWPDKMTAVSAVGPDEAPAGTASGASAEAGLAIKEEEVLLGEPDEAPAEAAGRPMPQAGVAIEDDEVAPNWPDNAAPSESAGVASFSVKLALRVGDAVDEARGQAAR